MLKICNYIYTARFLTSCSIQSSKNKHHQPTVKSKFYLFVKSETFIKLNTSCHKTTSFLELCFPFRKLFLLLFAVLPQTSINIFKIKIAGNQDLMKVTYLNETLLLELSSKSVTF